jgi:hypothetical protein
MTMPRNQGEEIVTTAPRTVNGTADPQAAGPDRMFMLGTGGLLVPVMTPADGTAGTGTVTGTAGRNGSTVPAVPSVPVARPAQSIIRRNQEPSEPEPGNRGSVTTVPGSTTAPTAATPKISLRGHGHQARAWLTIVVAVVASLGQAEYARTHSFVNMIRIPAFPGLWGYTIGPVDITPWLAVAVFDLAVAALLYSGRVAFRDKGLPPWPFWYAAGAVAGFSIYTNTRHAGGWVTAPASAVLFMLWFLTLYYEYLEWRRGEGHRADATPNLLLSKLILIDRRLALRAWIIASTRSMARGVAHRRELGETTTPRELAVQVGRLYLDVYDDQVVTQLRIDRAAKKERVRFWQRRERQVALSRAVMTASDAVDHYLGLPVIERSGIKPARISYAAAIEEPTPTRRVERPAAPAAAPATRPRVSGTVSPVSAPPAPPVIAAPAPKTAVPTVPAELFDQHKIRIALVKREAGDAWWNGPRPLTVDQVQKEYGVGNRRHASEVARCLAVLRDGRLTEGQPSQHTAPQGEVT